MLKKISSIFSGKEMLKNVSILTGGTIISQAIPIAIAPIISRLYSPDEIGVWTVYLSIVVFLGVFSTGRYQFAIMLPKQDEKAINILSLSFLILFVFCLLLSLILFLFYDMLLLFEPFQKIKSWIYFLPISIFFISTISILNNWNTRKKMFKNIFYSKIGQTTTTSFVNILVGLKNRALNISDLVILFKEEKEISIINNGLGQKGLIGGSIVGQFIGVIILFVSFFRKSFHLLQKVSFEKIKSEAKRYKEFPTVNAMQAGLDNVQSFGVTLIIVNYFSAYTLGLYSYAYRIIQAPLGMITGSYSQVFFQRAAEMHANNQKLNFIYRKSIKLFTLIGLPIFIVLAIFGQDIFAFVFGEEWRESGLFVQILSPWFFMNFLLSPMGQIPIILEKQKKVFMLSILGNALILISLFIGALFFDSILVSFVLISSTQFIYYLYLLSWYNRLTK